MTKKIKSIFNDQGYYLKEGLFQKKEIKMFEKEFDKIILQLRKSGENINARWGSSLTKSIEPENSEVIHTHNVQSYSSIMLNMIQNSELLNLVESLIGQDIVLHHTKLFLKPPKIGAAFPLHQDWSYFPTKKNSMIAAVLHLTESSEEMGCLRVVPGSHKLGKVKDSHGHVSKSKIHKDNSLESAVPLIAKSGDVVFFHCCTLHGSMINKSSKPRKTILVQLYSGNDEIIDGNSHTNVQLVLRGWNSSATREGAGNLSA